MIPNVKNRELESNGVAASSSFGISLNDSAHLMTILRDTLYSDKVLAVLREYSSNAWDAHRMVGKGDVPISVTMPTDMEPTLSIRDFGPGISHEDIFRVYTQYGASTKRHDDNAVGMLGIGSKSGFAYSDSFTVTSWHDGTKRVYVAVLDKSEKGMINLLHEELCGDETGVMVQIAVRPEDRGEFESKGQKLFQHFHPRPTINLDLPDLEKTRTVLSHGYLYNHTDAALADRGWVAVMGCVPYRVNLGQLHVGEHLSKISGVLYFNIGEVQINASREELKYSTETKKVLTEKLDLLVDEFVLHTMTQIESLPISPWEKKLRAQVFRQLHLPVPESLKSFALGTIHLKNCPISFSVKKRQTEITSRRKNRASAVLQEEAGHIFASTKTRIILKDMHRSLRGYDLGDFDYLIHKKDEDAAWFDVEKDLATFLEENGLTGIPIMKLSELPWDAPSRRSSTSTSNPKHKLHLFQLVQRPQLRAPWSSNWEPVTHAPTADDVFVVIKGFQSLHNDMLALHRKDRKLLEDLGEPMPPIYGYKTSEKRPVREEDLLGTEYNTWSENLTKSLLTDQVRELARHMHWAESTSLLSSGLQRLVQNHEALASLGPNHPIAVYVQKQAAGAAAWGSAPGRFRDAVEEIFARINDPTLEEEEAKNAVLRIHQRYPLLAHHGSGFINVTEDLIRHWAFYIKLMDQYLETERQDGKPHPIHDDERVPDGGLAGEEPHDPEGGGELPSCAAGAAE